MLEGEGFEIVDLGVNVKPEQIVEAVKAHQPQLLGFSAFLTTTMPFFKTNIEALQQAGLRDKVRIMVGGAPVTQEYADKMGADGYAADASAAVRLAKQLMQEMGYEVTLSKDSKGSAALAAAVDAVESMMRRAEEDA
jgi:5-methyltetrahydrofolate--homocysteine methyltransferase